MEGTWKVFFKVSKVLVKQFDLVLIALGIYALVNGFSNGFSTNLEPVYAVVVIILGIAIRAFRLFWKNKIKV